MPTQNLAVSAIESALKWRYATKFFDASKKIPAQDWQVIKDSLRWAPSSYGLQPWKFIQVENPALRQTLRDLSRNQAQVTDASNLIVLASYKKVDADFIDKHMARIAEVRGQSIDQLAAYRNGAVAILVDGPRAATAGPWAQRQVYLPMGFAMLAAAQMGIDCCPMEGIDAKGYDKVLGLEDGPWATLAALPFGYRSENDKYAQLAKVRFSEEDVFETR